MSKKKKPVQIGYIGGIHWHYDVSEPTSTPSVIHATYEAAQAEAEKTLGRHSQASWIVWEVQLP